MKILIINPNSSPEMTRDIEATALDCAPQGVEVVTLPTPGAPEYIDTYEDMALAVPGMMQLVRDNEAEFDAFVIACHCDPNIDLMKEITSKVVVGIGEASMKLASMIGHSFSVVATSNRSTPNKEAVIQKYHLEQYAASVRCPGEGLTSCDSKDLFMDAARLAIQEDMAEVIVLGCAGMCGLDKIMSKELGVPVLDGVSCGIHIAAGLVAMGVSTSKQRRYVGGVTAPH